MKYRDLNKIKLSAAKAQHDILKKNNRMRVSGTNKLTELFLTLAL